MSLIVDFNMAKEDGRIPALIPDGQAADFQPGAKTWITDGEGTRCLAVVSELLRDGQLALLEPIDGTTEREQPAYGAAAPA
jgi:hypothetical protein